MEQEKSQDEQPFKYSGFELLPTVRRVVVINHSGKFGDKDYGIVYENTNAKNVHISFQDNNGTMKIFIT